MRAATSAENAVELVRLSWSMDVSAAARQIKCPTLIVHPERDTVVPIEEGRLLAGLIPDCRFVSLDSDNHMPLAEEPSWSQLVLELRRFLAEEPPAVTASAPAARSKLALGALTPRERAVLEGIARGMDNTEIAGSLRMSEKTVRNHITRVFDKIEVEHRYQAIVRAREAGLGIADPASVR
jgi:DNA-binding CsgD family transcriptional regulator